MGKEKYEDYWKKKEQEKKATLNGSTTNSKRDRYDARWAQNYVSSLPSRLEDLSSRRKALYENYTSRFTDKDGNYINAYRGDTEDALTSFNSSKAYIDNESKAILDGLTKYGKYLDADKVKGIQDYLSSYSGDLDSMYKTYQSDHDYFSQWSDEESYNRAMTYAKEQEEKKNKYSAMSDDELNVEIERLKGSKKGNKLSNFAMMVVGAQEDVNSNTNLYSTGKSNQAYNDGVDNDISLIEKEKTNRKYKQIDELPGNVRSLIDELTVIDSKNDDEEFANKANALLSGFTGGNNVNYNVASNSERYGEITKELENMGVTNWQELLEYNKLRYNAEKNASTKADYAEMAKEHPVLSSFVSIPASLGKGLGALEMIEHIGSDVPLDPNSPYFGMSDLVNTTRETVMDEHDAHLNTGNETIDNIDLFDELYGTAMSIGDSVVAGVGTSGLKGVGGAVLGLSAASDSAQEVAENGGSASEAITTGLVAGINEMLWESVSLGKLDELLTNGLPKRGFKTFVKETFKSMGINASEELNTEASNLLADYLINGGASTYSETVQNYLSMGYTGDEAKNQAKKDMLVQMGKAGVGGALQGLFMGGGAGGISTVADAIDNKVYENKFYNQQGQNIIDQGNLSQLVEETEALGNEKTLKSLKDLANQVSGVKTEDLDVKGSKKYAHQVGKLYKGVQKAQFKNLSKSSETAFKNVIKAELESSGADNVEATADILVKAMHNEGLTRAESKQFQAVNGHEILNKALSSAEFNKKLTIEEKKQFEESRDNILSTVDLTHDKGKTKILSDSDYNISSDGKTTIEATGEDVDILKIDSLDGDDISLSVESGDSKQVVLAGELRLNEDYVVILEGLKDIKADFGLDVSSANSILALWDGYNGDVVDFSKAMKSGIMYGQYNMRKDFDNSRMGRNVPDNIRNRMFEIGREYKKRATTEQDAHRKATADANASSIGDFSITFADDVKYKKLNKKQKAQIDMAQIIAQAMGFNLEVFRSPKNALGKSMGENGSYNTSTNTMRLDIDAGTLDGKSLILFTQSHELTHFIKEWSPEKFKVFSDFLVEKYGEKDVPLQVLVQRKIDESVKQTEADKTGKHHVLSYDEALEEVVCDACEDFLADPNIQQTILMIAEVDQSIAQKIKNFIKNLINRLDKALRGLKGQSLAAQYTRSLDTESIQELKDLWVTALVDSRENVFQARKNDAEAQKNTTDEGDVKFEDRTFSYDELVAKGSIQGLVMDKTQQVKFNANGDLDIHYVFNFVKSQCEKVQTNSTEPTYYLNVPDIGKNVEITNDGIKHGFIKWKKNKNGNVPYRSVVNARAVLALPHILKTSIEVNRSDRNDADVNFTHVMIGTVGLEDINGTVEYYAVRSMIQDRMNQDPVLVECEVLGKLYAANAKKIDSPRVQATKVALAHSKVYAYNIAKFLEDVKNVFDNTFSEDVYQHLGMQRKSDDFSQNLKFQDRNDNHNTDLYSRISEMQLEVGRLRRSMESIEASEEFKEEQRKLSEAFSKDVDTGIELYKEWLEKSEYSKLKNKKDALEAELDKLRAERDKEISTKILNEEENAIAKSGLSEADYFRKQAVKEFGYTPYFYDAGYITPNGKMLNFSGEKGRHYGSRGQDHRAIGMIYAETEGTAALNRFIKDGNIRIMAESPGLDISTVVEPTKEQYSTIRKFISEYANKEFFNVDLTDESGKVIGSLEYEGRINSARVINDIKHFYATGEIREQSSVGKFLYSDRPIDSAINQSMTMDEAKQMIQRAFVLGGIYEWYDGEYKNGDEWLREQGADEVALHIENEYALQQKYLDKIQGVLDGEFYVQDILEAYLNGSLVGKEKPKAKRMDVSKNYRINDKRFYSPKRIENVKQLFEIAGQKLTAKNRAEVSSARAKILLFAHNKGASELLGLSQAELNKKLRSWSGYTNGAREASERLNRGVADSNKWTGIENCSWLYKNEVTTEELESLVKNIEGAADDYEKMYIARTMLALDTHIDWSWLSFEFDTNARVNQKHNGNSRILGFYRNDARKIVVSHNRPNTVAHEMGHALDYQWARDLGYGNYSALTDISRTTERITDADERQFFDNFKVFMDSLTDNGDIRSEYTQDPKEVFARFVARFVQWVDNTGGNHSYTTEVDYYNDKFTASNYIEFVKLLQEKAMLDAKKMSNDTLAEDVKFQDRVTPEQDAEYLELAKNPEKNEAKLREMVDSVASANGYTIKAYHATNADFTVFDIEKTADFNYHGKGIYFTNSTRDVENNYENYEGPDPWEKIDARAYELADEKYGISYEDTLTGDADIIDKLNECYDEAIDEFKSTIRRVTAYLKFDNPVILKKGESSDYEYDMSKHDGIIDEQVYENIGHSGMDENTIHYVVRNPRNIKSAELVTYDDNGNIIPLSERFNESNEDIRYQDRPYQPSLEDLGIDYKEENERLKADADRLKEMLKLQGTVTHGKVLAKASYEGVAKKLLHSFGMKRVTDADLVKELVNRLDSFYSYIINEDDLMWDEMFNKSMDIAKWLDGKLPEQVVYKNPNAVEILRDIREKGIMLSDKQKEEAAYYAGSLSAYRKMNFGNFKIVNEGGISLTDLWEQIVSDYPGAISQEYIEQGEVAENLPSLIVEVVELMRQTENVINDENRLSYLRDMATEIYDSYWSIPTVKTLADKHQQQVNLLKSKHKAEMDALKEKKDTKLKNTKEYYQDMVRKIRADKDAKLNAYKERVTEQKKKNVEGRNKTATKNKIKRVIKTLESLYGNPTKEKNVKIEFQDMVKKALIMAEAIFDSENISSSDILSGNITTRLGENERKKLDEWRKVYERRQDYRDKLDVLESSGKVNQKTHDELLDMISRCNKKLNALSRNLSDVVERQRAELNDNSVQDAIDSLVEAYKSLEDSTEGYAKAAYNDYVAKRLDALKTSLKNTTVKTMTLTQLDEVYQAYKMVLTTVRTANELFVNNKRMSVTEMGEAVIREVENVAKPTDDKVAALRDIRKYSWEELKPIYAFERIGSKTLLELFKDARKGEDVLGRDVADAQSFFREKSKTYGYDSWDFDERKDFKLADGRTFNISLQEIMSIYAYSKREQALDHITKGGFVFDDKEFFTDTKEKGLKGKIKKERTTVEAYRLNDDVFYKIINSLTKEQKKFIDDMQEYLSAVMGAKGNEVSRVLYGIDLFKEKYYFPLMSSNDFIQQTNNPVGEVALKNSGMAKATVPRAQNPIVLQDFMDVWTEHVNKMSTYHALVLPIENLNKVFNYTGYARDNRSVSVQTILKGVYGDAVNRYITNFITDLNGGIKTQSSGNWVMKGISRFKKTAVAASTSVVVQQPTAIVRAMAMINPKYFVHKSDGLKHNEAWEELKKYAPIAIVKEMGGFDVGSGKQVAGYITAKTYKGKDKVKGFVTDSSYRDEAFMWGATKADESGWITIWNAVKREIADTTTHKVGSDEFLKACGERFTDIITYTQVYDSVFSRSGFMRNKGEISKMATSFMGEPTTSFNMLYNAVLQAKRGNISKGEMTKIMGATVSSIILASIAKSLIYALRDDDEDESYAEKYAQALTNSLSEDLFIPNMLPYVSDITSLLSGWDVERTDMAILKDFKDAVDGLDSSSKSLWRKIEDLAGAVAAFGGIPAKNVMRTVREMYNLMANVLDDNISSASDVGDAIVETFTGETSSSDINEALEKGKTDKAKKIINDLVSDKIKQGKTEKEAKASIKSSVTSYWKELYLQAYRDKDNAEMLRIRRILQSTGLYDDVVETCSNWIKSMKDEKTTDTTFKKW